MNRPAIGSRSQSTSVPIVEGSFPAIAGVATAISTATRAKIAVKIVTPIASPRFFQNGRPSSTL